jgi:phosphoglycolate phosphatase
MPTADQRELREARHVAGHRVPGSGTLTAVLLLFDIDGTLLQRATREHREAVHAALRDVYGIAAPDSAAVDAAGRTDVEIARQILLRHGLTAAAIDAGLPEFRPSVARHYARLVPRDLSSFLAPGVPATLARLAAREDRRLSLVTGNLEPVARMKLRAAGIARFFPTGQGAFGSDHEDRTQLPSIARARAGRSTGGAPWPRHRTVVIGDTPRDIACARAAGVRCIAVATGPYPARDLGGADVVVHGVPELAAALDTLE